MLEPIGYFHNLPGIASPSGSAIVSSESELFFEAMLTEALADGSADESSIGTELAGIAGLPLAQGRPLAETAYRATVVPHRPVQSPDHPGDKSNSVEPAGLQVSAAPNRFVQWMDRHALTHSAHHCAMFFRQALEVAGISTSDRPASGDAGDYGPFLLRHGATAVSTDKDYQPQAGDTAVFEKTAEHPFGHIQVFDGERWVSDFRQHNFSPYRDAATTPAFTVYRMPESRS